MRKILNEPLLHFLALGAFLFVLFNWVGDYVAPRDNRIMVMPGRIEHLAASFQRTWQRPPTAQELETLIDGYIREEIYYREALALGLDEDDTIVRRRLTQKLEFLTADAVEALEPSDDELREHLQTHPDSFREEPRASFRQVYLNPDRHTGDLKKIAAEVLRRLESGDTPAAGFAALGDRLLVPAEMTLAGRGEIERLFGTRFADRLMETAPGRWSGPVESGYGLHLVYVDERHDAYLPELNEVRDVVLREWLSQRREHVDEAFYQRLRERYTVTVEMPEPRSAETMGKASSIVNAR